VCGRADDKNLVVSADIEEPFRCGRRRAIKQIIVNLLSNAVKFTPDGGKVTVRSRVLRDSIVLMIADTGIGIAPQSLARLGRPFEQVESQLTKTYHGSGLGLAIARSLTHCMAERCGALQARTAPSSACRCPATGATPREDFRAPNTRGP